VVRAIQDLRKTSGLAVEDRIELWMRSGDPAAASALEEHRDFIGGEVLAETVHAGDDPAGDHGATLELDAATVELGIRKAARS
jgi:isoleucyl-tRNA synthetase